jgi:hypothetical protein
LSGDDALTYFNWRKISICRLGQDQKNIIAKAISLEEGLPCHPGGARLDGTRSTLAADSRDGHSGD